jgi:cardiolipin synthase
MDMKIVKPFLLFFLLVSILGFSNGCSTLPNVSEKIDEAPTAPEPRQIVSSKGLLSPEKSKAIMERLKNSVNPTDILERHESVVESVTESPLTKGNKVTLLADGQATYAAKQYKMPKTISILKAISLKVIRQAENFPICCCKNRRKVYR